jgi:hypothetical protein
MKKIKISKQVAIGWWPLACGRLRALCVRGWWRLLLALRVPAPRVLRPGLWAPWRLPCWLWCRCVVGCVRLALRFVLLLLLPWLVALLVRWLA